MKAVAFIFLFLFTTMTHAADVERLSTLFKQNFNHFYQPRFCGKNITLFVSEAAKLGIDLSNSHILRIEGAGFLETSGFYTRTTPNERVMLGYFHYVLMADHTIFDFDLAEPLVLEIEDYVRLQFTPPYQPYVIFGINFNPLEQLPWWTVKGYEWQNFLASTTPQMTWTKKLNQFVDLVQVMNRSRVR